MSSQGLLGAIYQYWDIKPKARLHRRNTFFETHKVSNRDALLFCVGAVSIGILLISVALVGGAIIWMYL